MYLDKTLEERMQLPTFKVLWELMPQKEKDYMTQAGHLPIKDRILFVLKFGETSGLITYNEYHFMLRYFEII